MFVYKTPKELEALSEYQLEKYLDEKQKHEEKVAKENAEKAAKEVSDKAIEDAKKDFDQKLEDAKKAQEEAIEAQKTELQSRIDELTAKLQRTGLNDRGDRIKTMSELIEAKLSTDEGEEMLKNFMKGMKEKFNTDVETSKVFLKPTANGGYSNPDLVGIYSQGHNNLHARDLMRVFPVSEFADMVKYLRLEVDPAADSIGLVGEGVKKPKIGYIPTPVSTPIRKIAGLLDVSDESMNDLKGFRAWLASELPLAYLDVEDEYVFNHQTDGVVTLAQTWVPNGSVTAASNAWDILVSARTQVSLNKRRATAAIVSPIVYQELLINKDLEQAYTYPIIIDANGVLRIGTLPVYESNSFEDGEFLVGDFATGAALHQKEAMNIRYSEENATNFEDNLITVRIEGRVCVSVYKPDAFVKGEVSFPTT